MGTHKHKDKFKSNGGKIIVMKSRPLWWSHLISRDEKEKGSWLGYRVNEGWDKYVGS